MFSFREVAEKDGTETTVEHLDQDYIPLEEPKVPDIVSVSKCGVKVLSQD